MIDVGLERAHRAIAHMQAAHALVLAIHGEPNAGNCEICRWLQQTRAAVNNLEGEVARLIQTPAPRPASRRR